MTLVHVDDPHDAALDPSRRVASDRREHLDTDGNPVDAQVAQHACGVAEEPAPCRGY
ncbi:MAG: hypothetical protein M0Z30_00860 [Actinomycetota bacterium]|nr:hypothetical protein [Actinomycetota bacterium]